jgi:Zn-dependent protease
MRENLSSMIEIKNILMSDIVLIIAMSLTLSGGIFGASSEGGILSSFLYFLPIAALAVSLSFILHELMHKFVAQHYGAIAGFRSSMSGLLITLATGAFGFLLGIPGATVIFAHSFNKKQYGIVSLAGPLTNFVVFGVFLAMLTIINPPQSSYLFAVLYITLFISIILAFFNMLPVFPLDGSKVLAWDKRVYFGTMAAIFLLMLFFTPIPITTIIFMIIIAVFFSLFYKNLI